MKTIFLILLERRRKSWKQDKYSTSTLTVMKSEDSSWNLAVFQHPSTFGTLAMDVDLKKFTINDPDTFVNRKGFFDRVVVLGSVDTFSTARLGLENHRWLLPLLTTSSTMFMIFNCSVKSDADFRNVLTTTTNRSITLIENIDCNETVLHDRGPWSPEL
ncbi:hypothetical protein Ddye_028260 [Dipteronia dyeriana]|uniref:Uncharacterized protein n=1 Tax=Dipteronia dyeriana TaxID=168575 RepID=A0AAD9TRJ2_9ROSI|nr:hypothetical protein Ddye_028260 [Dipteronia dyeriana]